MGRAKQWDLRRGGADRVFEPGQSARPDAVVRALATASRSLRLYPATSPIPRQSVDAAITALSEYFAEGEPVLALTLDREGFATRGQSVGAGASGSLEFAGELRDHGVAELAFTPGCTAEELLGFLGAVGRDPEQVRAAGGLGAVMAAEGAECVRVTDVVLTVVEQVGPAPDEDIDDFLRQLATDPEKLAAWFAAAAAGDPATFEEGLMELVRVVGPSGYQSLLSTLSGAFMAQAPDAKDALLGLSLDPGPTRDLTGGMFGLLGSGDIAGSVLGGTFGKNMLSLSTALTHLPLEQVTAQVRAEVQAMLPGAGKTSKEADFLSHMIEVRERTTPETALVDADGTYRSVLDATNLPEDVIGRAREAVTGSGKALSAASVRTMLTLLDQQQDFELYCAGADSLAGMVPRLIEQGDLQLAARILTEISNRQAMNTGPWPELSERLRRALAAAAGPRSMGALVRATVDNPDLIPAGREIMRYAGDSGPAALVAEAITLKAEGLAAAEQLLGRRVVDLLAQLAPQAQWFQLAPIVERLVREGDPRSLSAVELLMNRPDEQSRREIAQGLVAAGGPAAQQLLAKALRDPSAEVAIAAARAIGREGGSGAAAALSARLGEIEMDGADFLLARELIGALARIPDPAADEALAKIASRRALIKRGHFAEVQDLVQQAQAMRAAQGGGRS